MKYYVNKIYMHFVFASNCLFVYIFHPLEPLIIKHTISKQLH